MNVLYIECNMGIAGDMLSAALLELHSDRAKILDELNGMGLPGVSFEAQKAEKCGIMGTHMKVTVDGDEEESVDVALQDYKDDHYHDHDNHSEHHDHEDHDHHGHDHHHSHIHRSMADIERIVRDLKLSDKVKADIINVYKLIASAESRVHGREVSEIHFHEVGAMDAIGDIAAVCLMMNELSPDRVVASPVHVGSGQVRCAHGILPVPAPATALLLEGIPSYSGDVKGELCTPTGAALLKYFADDFGAQPVMSMGSIGYGMGKKDFAVANCVRAMLGESMSEAVMMPNGNDLLKKNDKIYGIDQEDELTDTVIELVCNLDDMTPEQIGFATERLMEEGALDVFTTSIAMKKNRPGTMLTVLCRESSKAETVRQIFKYTTTIGIRESLCERYILSRAEKTIDTEDGEIRVKEVCGYGVKREKKEYEDLAKIARKKGEGII